MHRRLAAAIEAGDPESVEENAALIAEHLEAAGDLHAAYGWHMRAATWSTNRDIAAARLSWERAREIADALPADDPDRAAMRIAPRTLLCGTAWRVHVNECRGPLRGAAGAVQPPPATRHRWPSAWRAGDGARVQARRRGRRRRWHPNTWPCIESIGDPTLTVGLSFAAIYAKVESGEWGDVLRWSQSVIDLADGDPAKGDFVVGSPLAVALHVAGSPGGGWVVPDGATTSTRRRHGPQRRPHVLRHGRRLRLRHGNTVWRAGPTIARCARSRRRYGLPNDPVTISRWPRPVGAGRGAGAPPNGCGA